MAGPVRQAYEACPPWTAFRGTGRPVGALSGQPKKPGVHPMKGALAWLIGIPIPIIIILYLLDVF